MYNVTLSVTDARGNTGTDSLEMTVIRLRGDDDGGWSLAVIAMVVIAVVLLVVAAVVVMLRYAKDLRM